MAEPTCENCVYFRSAQVLGTCRRYPIPQNKHQSDWCGEYEVKMVVLSVYDIVTDTATEMVVPKKPGRKPKNGNQSAA